MSYRTPALMASAVQVQSSTVPPTVSQRAFRCTNPRFRVSTSTEPPKILIPSAYRTRTLAIVHRVPTVPSTHRPRNSSIPAQMLAPVVTKEMQLFKLGPTNKNNLRNVRARAQSLNEVNLNP